MVQKGIRITKTKMEVKTMLEAKTKEQLHHIAEMLGADITRWEIGAYPIRTLELDVPISFDTMAKIVDYLREQKQQR